MTNIEKEISQGKYYSAYNDLNKIGYVLSLIHIWMCIRDRGGNVMPVQIKDYFNFISVLPIQLIIGSSWNMNYNQNIHYVSDR